RFEAELDLPLAAAEAGVAPEEFLKALDRAPHLAQQLGSLKVEGGTVQRQVFVDAFGDLVRVLNLGEFQAPVKAAYARLLRRGDALLRQGDAAGAVQAYAEALALHPLDVPALVGRGDAYRQKSDP